MKKRSLALIATYISLSFYAWGMEEITRGIEQMTLNQEPENIQDLSQENLVDRLTNLELKQAATTSFDIVCQAQLLMDGNSFSQNLFEIINNTIRQFCYRPIHDYFNNMPHDQLIDLCDYWQNPRVIELTKELHNISINLQKYQKESTQDNAMPLDFPHDKIGKLCKKLESYITEPRAEMFCISFKNIHNILYTFYQDITSRYPDELSLLDHIESSYPTLESDIVDIYKEYKPICDEKINSLIKEQLQK